jgi:hypothetical protein
VEGRGFAQGEPALPQVQEAIRKARPIIAGFGARAEVSPVGGAAPE